MSLSLIRPTVEQACAQLAELNSPEKVALAFMTVIFLLEQALLDPARYGSLKADSKTLRARVLDISGGAAFFESAGFNPGGDSYTLDADAGEAELRRRVDVIKGGASCAERVLAAIVTVGDSNAGDAAVTAVKLARTYCSNILAHQADEAKRRIGASNKALGARLLATKGGGELLLAVGFELTGELYVCTASFPELQICVGMLDRAESVWAEMAIAAGVVPGAAGSSGAAESDPNHLAEAIPVSSITIAKLPLATALDQRRGAADMEPALVADSTRSAVQLFLWMAVSKRWRLFAWMQTPSTVVEWVRPTVEGAPYELVLEVDLGDGKALELGCTVLPLGEPENEYLTANRFIGQHYESLSSNHLEEIARNVRARVAPVLETLKNLVKAMEAQN
mmetsp:Transcript_38366/g.95018  ORF Transcript_38366/g.95018 Transcript_38366/m.95018 type:complete len:394 (+) Transcript_38366:175-1356(+)